MTGGLDGGLTAGVEGMKEPRARWTHMDPDRRLEAFKEINSNLVGDMWLLHEDSTHFDMIIKKDSILAKKDGIFNKSEADSKRKKKIL